MQLLDGSSTWSIGCNVLWSCRGLSGSRRLCKGECKFNMGDLFLDKNKRKDSPSFSFRIFLLVLSKFMQIFKLPISKLSNVSSRIWEPYLWNVIIKENTAIPPSSLGGDESYFRCHLTLNFKACILYWLDYVQIYFCLCKLFSRLLIYEMCLITIWFNAYSVITFYWSSIFVNVFCIGGRFWFDLVAQTVKNPPTMLETWVQILGWDVPLEERMATHSTIPASRIPTDRGDWWGTVHEVAKNWT